MPEERSKVKQESTVVKKAEGQPGTAVIVPIVQSKANTTFEKP